MAGLAKRITGKLGDLAEAGTLVVLLPVGLAVGWVALAAAPVLSSWIGRLAPPKPADQDRPNDPAPRAPAANSNRAPVVIAVPTPAAPGGRPQTPKPATRPEPRPAPRQPVDRPKPAESWLVVVNPSLDDSAFAVNNTKANAALADLVTFYLGQQAKMPVLNLGRLQGYNQRMNQIAALAKQGKKLFVLTLASSDLYNMANGNTVYAVPQRYGVQQHPDVLQTRDLALGIGRRMAEGIAAVFNQFPKKLDPKQVQAPLDTFANVLTATGWINRLLPVNRWTQKAWMDALAVQDFAIHNTMYDGVYKGTTNTAALELRVGDQTFGPGADRPLIVGPNGQPMPVANLWVNYADPSFDKGLLEALASKARGSSTEWEAAEQIASRISSVLSQSLRGK